MSPAAHWFRILIGIIGLGLTLLAAIPLQFNQPLVLVVLALLMLAADLWLAIPIDRQRVLSLGATITFVTFLQFGAAAAAVLQIATFVLGQGLRRLLPGAQSYSGIFVLFNAGQLGLCGLCGGALVYLLTGTPLWSAPPQPLSALLLYSSAYLLANIALTTIATWLRFGWSEVRTTLWPNISLWTAISFAFSAPIALFVVSVETPTSFIVDVLVAFSLLVVLSYVVRLTLRYQEANRELRALNEISQRLAASLDLNDLFPAIYESVRMVMPVDMFFIGLLSDDHTEIDVPYLIENEELLAPRRYAVEGSLSEEVLRAQQPVLFDAETVRAHRKGFGQPHLHPAAAMFTPLQVGSQVIGLMSAQSLQPQRYTEQHLQLFAAIGRMAGVAINNARLFAREKAVQRSRDEFVSLVAHELKNPLAALMGHIQLLERRLRSDEEKLRRPVQVILEQGERMSRLVEDLLDLSRADTGRLPLHIQRLDMLTLIRNVVEQQHTLSRAHQLRVEHPERLPLLQGDVHRLTQVLQNLLSNAIKYSPQGGPITVRVAVHGREAPLWPRRLRKAIAAAELWVVVAVEDRGIGVPPEHLQRIFDRFYRAPNIAQLDIAGTGLGLSVVESLVRAHGGVVWAESVWGEGSTFFFALPVPPHEALAYQQALEQQPLPQSQA